MSVNAEASSPKRINHLPEEASALLDGKRPLKRDRLANLARKRMVLGASWILRSMGPDGRFAYLYYPETDTYNRKQYNEVRHAGTIYSLCQSFELNQDARWPRSIDAACEWLRQSSVPTPHGGRAFVYRGRMKLGGQALAIVALLERRRVLNRHDYDDLIAELTTFLDLLEFEDAPGRYYNSFEVESGEMLPTPDSDYYPGECLLALTRLAQHFPDGPFLEQAVRAGEYLVKVRDGDIIEAGAVPRQDHWLAKALSELYPMHPDPSFAAVAYMQAEAMMRSQYPVTHANWRQIGGSRRGSSVNYTSTATKAEAMNAVWSLATYRGDEEMVERVSEAALRTVQFQMRVQYTSELARLFPGPGRVVGAWAQDEKESYVRVDFVQHNISALAGAFHLVQTGHMPVASDKEGENYGRQALLTAQSIDVFRGPNYWLPRPMVHVRLDAQNLVDKEAAAFASLAGRLTALLQSFEPDALVEPPSDPGEALAFLMLGLQKLGGWEVQATKSIERDTPGIYDVICEVADPAMGRELADLSLIALDDLLQGIAHSTAFITRFESSLVNPATTEEIGDTPRFVREARRRGIPLKQPLKSSALMEFGNGKYTKQFWRLWTSDTTIHGVRIAGNKGMANKFLLERGLPVPANTVVTTMSQAVAAASRIGYPVVLKPLAANHSRGVMPDIRDEDELRQSFPRTQSFSKSGQVVVERFLEGISYRILVIDYKIFAVLEREIASVTGDGVRTVEELVEIENSRPERQVVGGNYLAPIQINDQSINALAKQGLTVDAVPEAGRVVKVKYIPSGANGGTRVDVTETIHPDNAAIACQACRSLGIDLAGLDFLAPDIAKSVWETGGGIVEINTAPGLYPHYQPTAGPPRDPVPAILEMMFPPGSPVRVPVIALAGPGDLDQLGAAIGDVLTRNGETVGRSTAGGAMIGSMQTRTQHPFGPSPVLAALQNPDVETAILTVNDADLERPGLEFHEVDVAVITGIQGRNDAHRIGPEEVVAQMVVEGGSVVLDGASFASLGSFIPPRVNVILVSDDASKTEVQSHLQAGGTAVAGVAGDGIQVLRKDGVTLSVATQLDIPLATAALAVAAALAHGVSPDVLGEIG